MGLDLTTPPSARVVVAAGPLRVRCYAPTTRIELRGTPIAGVRRLPLPLRRIARRRHVPGERPLPCVRRIWDAVATATGPFEALTRGRIQNHARKSMLLSRTS
jgi:hypothetical protein